MQSEDVHITQVKDVLPKTGLLSQVDFLDSVRHALQLSRVADAVDPQSANTLVGELQSLADLVDSIGSSNSNDNGAQGYGAKRIVAIHIKGIKVGSCLRREDSADGLQEILAKHPRASTQYQAASTMLQQTLSATLAALQADSPESTIVLLALPTYSPPIFRKRNVWLKPFSDLSARYVANPASLKKRSGSVTERAPKRTPTPLVPSSFTCFDSAASLNNATDSCNNGNGVAVKGVSALMGGKRESCWVCSCGKTSVGNKKIQWAGQGCEKVDLSSYVPVTRPTCADDGSQGLYASILLGAGPVRGAAGVGDAALLGGHGRAAWHARERERERRRGKEGVSVLSMSATVFFCPCRFSSSRRAAKFRRNFVGTWSEFPEFVDSNCKLRSCDDGRPRRVAD